MGTCDARQAFSARLLITTLAALGVFVSDGAEKRSMHDVRKQDAARDARLPTRKLQQPHTVFRYVTPKESVREKQRGIAPGSHFTSRATPGRPVTSQNAQRREGLGANHTVRETIVLPKGQQVKSGKVIGGSPGRGEILTATKVPPKNIKKTVRLH